MGKAPPCWEASPPSPPRRRVTGKCEWAGPAVPRDQGASSSTFPRPLRQLQEEQVLSLLQASCPREGHTPTPLDPRVCFLLLVCFSVE